MKTLLTGASGFIGSGYLRLYRKDCRSLVRRGNVVDCDDVFEIDEINSHTEFGNAFHDVDCIVHLAGLAHTHKFSESEYTITNVKGTLHLALLAANSGVKRFVFISSIGVMGLNTHGAPFKESDEPNPYNPYTMSKWRAEQGLVKISKSTNMEVVIIRPALVYSNAAPGNFGALVSLVKSTCFLPFAMANNRRSFVSLNNLINFIHLCTTHPQAKGEIFLLSDGNDLSIRELTDEISLSLSKSLYQLPIPLKIMKAFFKVIGKGKQSHQLFDDLQVDSSKARNLLGWSPVEGMSVALRG